MSDTEVGASTYRLLRGRLEAAAAELGRRAEALNERRVAAFGTAALELVATERVRTENNVVPRDVEAVGDQLVLAYNAEAGVRGELRPEDVFSVHHVEVRDGAVVLSPNPEGLADSALDDDRFRRDFVELHTYFKETRIQQVYRRGQHLLAVFRTGTAQTDVRVLRWAIDPDGSLTYLDDRGDRDHRFPPHQDVEWLATTRADHVDNRYVAIDDRVFIDPLGGTLDLRLADATAEGEVVLSERLADADQSLQDCEISFALAGADLVLLRILGYREPVRRHFVVNLLTRTATRLDALGEAFRQLPEGQGLIFPEGIYLRTGEVRRFDLDSTEMELLDVVRSPNGEDVLYVFHQRSDGRSILLPYNIVRQDVTTPVWCHGHCLFDDGRMIVFREEAEPTRVHPLQIWSTPFCSDEWYADHHRSRGPLDRIGNPDLVAGIADALALVRLVDDVEASAEVYGDLLGSAGRFLDTHHWVGDEAVVGESGGLATAAHDIRMAAEAVIDEFERLEEVRAAAATALAEAEAGLDGFLDEVRRDPPKRTDGFIGRLDELRHHLGQLHTIGELREVDTVAVEALVERATDANDRLARSAADHLASDGSFDHYHEDLVAIAERVPGTEASIEVEALRDELDAVADAMELVAGTVGDLVVADPRIRTAVLEHVSAVLAELNRVRAAVEGRHGELVEAETGAAFTTELGLFGQTVAAAVARIDTPEDCDDALARLLLQLEQLESSGPRTDAQLDELARRRDDLVEVVGGRRQRLIDERQRHAERLVTAGGRTLDRLTERAASLSDVADVNGFFAAGPMVGRIRTLVDDLRGLGEPVRADELASRLGTARDRALRAVRDRADLYDGDAVRLGRHRFSVEDRRRELTLAPTDGGLSAVLTGTDLRVPIVDDELAARAELWDRPWPSETPELYRGLYLAGTIVLDRRDDHEGMAELAGGSRDGTEEPPEAALAAVRTAVEERLDEGYDRGVHDRDAARIVAALADRVIAAGPLVTPAPVRAEAVWAWAQRLDAAGRARWAARGRAAADLGIGAEATSDLAAELAAELALDVGGARYLLTEATTPTDDTDDGITFAIPTEAADVAAELAGRPTVTAALTALDDDPDGTRSLLARYVERTCDRPDLREDVVSALVTPELRRRPVDADLTVDVDGLAGNHPTIAGGRLTGRADRWLAAIEHHRRDAVPAHRALAQRRRVVLDDLRSRLRLDDLEPRVPEGFVRNRLIDRLYLPLIGDNLARQIGTVDDDGGARSGLLLLLSPPGYGKTTLVDYVADRLGMALVKVSGPGLGHEVTSLDPGRAPSATAAREIERINLAFALGSNVMLYLDDIQHTSPELLQRFISLCDAQRRIEGVVEGRATTFDLRGKRFAVVMAGNPYTESGERFQVPDMLANRADTYNLGDVVAGNDDLFARSYLENALGANPVVAPLVGRDRADLDELLRAGAGGIDETRLSHGYSAAELAEIGTALDHLRRVQRVVLAVNRQYIASAATDDRYRTEPPFLLQGSYRNMVRMAAKLLPAMTPAEVEAVIDDHYQAEAQALTGAAEANLLKLDELRGRLDGDRRARWKEIVSAFRRRQRLGGDDGDPTARVVAAIEEVALALRYGGSVGEVS